MLEKKADFTWLDLNFKGGSCRSSCEIPVICQLYQFSAECEEKHQPQKCRMPLVSDIRIIHGNAKRCLGNLLFWKLKIFHGKAFLMDGLYNYAKDH